jgi:hypothetical protein
VRSIVALILSAALLATTIPLNAQKAAAATPSGPKVVLTPGDSVTLTLADAQVVSGTVGFVLANGFFLEDPPNPARFVLFQDYRFTRKPGEVTGISVRHKGRPWVLQTVTTGVIVYLGVMMLLVPRT